jgi:lytic cellulose monooxygenase (C4-dehydrogenating)
MSSLVRSPSALLRMLTVATVAAAVASVALVTGASAHGSIVDPASRNYGCWLRWGSDFQNPQMATEDPMCWQAWQAEPNAMWNWNGLYRDGVAGDPQAVIPDGQLCSAGHTQSGRYNAMDAVGDWRATSISNDFHVKLWDQASHGADYIRVYVSRQGFDPVTQPLAWSDLVLVGQIGNTPAAQWTPESAGGVSIQVAGSAPGLTGRHIVYTIWQASHMDQSYYFCSDVSFGGAGGTPSPAPSASPSSGPSPAPSASPTGAPSPTGPSSPGTGGSAGCTATYRSVSQWPGGFQADVQVTAGSAAINGWTVRWSYGSGEQVASSWNATVTTSGSAVTAANASYNGHLGAGASTTFGLLGSMPGTTVAPVATCTPS